MSAMPNEDATATDHSTDIDMEHADAPPRTGVYASLRGKRAVILGGSRGIGRAIAERLAAEGCHVLLNYHRSMAAAEEAVEACRAYGVDADMVRADIGNTAQLRALFARAEGWGGIDILINNAARGLERPRPALTQRPKHLHETMEVNLFAPWTAAQIAAPLIAARGGGSIVNLLSPGAWQYMPGYSAVGVSKAALASLTRYLAVELAPQGIRVNGVSAGWVEGSEGDHSYRGGVADRVRPHVPAGRNVHPDDIAATVAWVCSDQAPMLVGETLHLDGGFGIGAWRTVLDDAPPAGE